MAAGSTKIREFFRYAHSRNTFDSDLIASQYPESWMYAGPDGVRVAVKADVLAGLAKGKEWLRTLGHVSTTLVSMVRPPWRRKGRNSMKRLPALLVAVAFVSGAAALGQGAASYDLVLAGGRVIDPGSGLDAVRHVGITGGSVRALSASPLQGRVTIDAAGLVVALASSIFITTDKRRRTTS